MSASLLYYIITGLQTYKALYDSAISNKMYVSRIGN